MYKCICKVCNKEFYDRKERLTKFVNDIYGR